MSATDAEIAGILRGHVDAARAEVERLKRRESFLIHAAWTAGRKAQRCHSTADIVRIHARADAMEAKEPKR